MTSTVRLMMNGSRYAASLLLIAIGSSLAACGDSGGPAERVNTFTNAVSDDVSSGGPLQWVRARTSDEERVVTIDFVGGAEYDPGNFCTVRYATTVTYTNGSVTVLVSGWSPPPPTSTSIPVGCPLLGHPRTVTVTLDEPLGARSLINAATGEAHPVNVEPWAPQTSTSAGEAPPSPSSDLPAAHPSTAPSDASPSTTAVVAFGAVAPIANAAILGLPVPMPAGWVVSGVQGGLTNGSGEQLGALDSTPLTGDSYRTLTVYMVRGDGTAVARLVSEEWPEPRVPITMPAGVTIPGAETLQIGGREVNHLPQDLADSTLRLPGFSATGSWSWIDDDGRRLWLEVSGRSDGVAELITSVRPVNGAEMGAAITAGQQAMRAWPALATATAPDGTRLSARGTGATVVAICTDSAPEVAPGITTCGSIGQLYHPDGVTGVAVTRAATAAGPRSAAWLPPAFASPLAPGPVVLDGGPSGSFAYDFHELATVGPGPTPNSQMFTAFARAYTDLIGLPNIGP